MGSIRDHLLGHSPLLQGIHESDHTAEHCGRALSRPAATAPKGCDTSQKVAACQCIVKLLQHESAGAMAQICLWWQAPAGSAAACATLLLDSKSKC